MEKINWKEFWRTYRETEIESEKDLYFEVGKTVDQQPVSEEVLRKSVQLVAHGLALTGDDKLLELCCGNGLMTRNLAAVVEEICAVDFAERLIRHARRFRPAPNVRYICAEAVGFVKELSLSKAYIPSKVLLGDALGYFEPAMVEEILTAACYLTGNRFTLMATGIPSDDLKWNFYNTPERVRRYEDNQLREGNTNDGIGRWWRVSELERLARDRGLQLTVRRQPHELSDFRIDAIFSCDR